MRDFNRDGSPIVWIVFTIATCIVLAIRIGGLV